MVTGLTNSESNKIVCMCTCVHKYKFILDKINMCLL